MRRSSFFSGGAVELSVKKCHLLQCYIDSPPQAKILSMSAFKLYFCKGIEHENRPPQARFFLILDTKNIS